MDADDSYRFEVWGNPQPDEERSALVIRRWCEAQMDEALRDWQFHNPHHGLDLEGLLRKRRELFRLKFDPAVLIRIADMG